MRRPSGGPVRVRFATVPTGLLHLGAARVAVVNTLFAGRYGSEMMLRLDDSDPSARDAAAAQALEADIAWLGLPIGSVVHQGDRAALYQNAAARLEQAGRLYPCFESEDELRAKRDLRVKRGQSPAYDRAMLRLTAAQRASAEAGGKRPYWRFRLSGDTVTWQDGLLGARSVKLPAVSDPVAVRADGVALPVFTSAVDDLDLGITHVIRSEEHATSAGIQLDMRLALGGDADSLGFAHLPVLTDGGGGRLSRRGGNVTIRSLRQDGMEPDAVVGYLARLGARRAPEPLGVAGLVSGFELQRLADAPARLDMVALLALNRRALAAAPFAAVASRLPQGVSEAFWLAVRGSVDTLDEARRWWEIVAGEIVPPVLDGERDMLRIALDLVPPEPWDGGVWTRWLGVVAGRTGRPGADLELALRSALTGEEAGPDLGPLLPLIGRARIAERLRMATR